MRVLIINHETRYIDELQALFADCETTVVRHDAFPARSDIEQAFDLIVLSGGPIHISSPENLVEEKEFLRTTTTPILGICLGFQIISVIFGDGIVDRASKRSGLHPFSLFGESGELFYANDCAVISLPNEFQSLATEKDDATGRNYLLAFRHKTRPIIDLQGHPEKSGAGGKRLREAIFRELGLTSPSPSRNLRG